MKFIYTFYEYLLSNHFDETKRNIPIFIVSLVLSLLFSSFRNLYISAFLFCLLIVSSLKVVSSTIRGYNDFIK